MPEINWNGDATTAPYSSRYDEAAGDLILAEDNNGNTVLLEWDGTTWQYRGPVEMNGEDVSGVGTLTATDVVADSVSTVEADITQIPTGQQQANEERPNKSGIYKKYHPLTGGDTTTAFPSNPSPYTSFIFANEETLGHSAVFVWEGEDKDITKVIDSVGVWGISAGANDHNMYSNAGDLTLENNTPKNRQYRLTLLG